ncbi:MAG TPA: sigma-54 dependent transcriptional regulator [Thermoanaerobaculia bacterium]|nr:sigma-54 dependent transcriptional regulator [Thermoanaerobaculia bacterium]
MEARILIIDDEDIFREDLAALLRQEGYHCVTAPDGERGAAVAELEAPDIVLSDLVMPGMSGIRLVETLASVCPETPVILLTAHGSMQTALEAFRAGAVDYILKPVLPEDLSQKVRRCLERTKLERELRYLRREISESGSGTTMVGSSAAIETVRDLVRKVGPSSSPVLISGESGTGKELVARALHEAAFNGTAPFIAVNCAALPPTLAESELFGHVRGAFTGAHRDRPGYFELANGGTLFLDEISDLPIELQPKLLRAIEQQEIYRVGGTHTIRARGRIIAATNRDLKGEMASGRFRDDLYFRLSVVEIALPPLRDRRQDIPLLVEHLIRRLAQRRGRPISRVSNAAMRALMTAPWRGNVRELENVLERAILLSEDVCIGIESLPLELRGGAERPELIEDLRLAVRAYEREHIRSVLGATAGNREEAARRLGIDASTLYRRMRRSGL